MTNRALLTNVRLFLSSPDLQRSSTYSPWVAGPAASSSPDHVHAGIEDKAGLARPASGWCDDSGVQSPSNSRQLMVSATMDAHRNILVVWLTGTSRPVPLRKSSPWFCMHSLRYYTLGLLWSRSFFRSCSVGMALVSFKHEGIDCN